MIWLTWRQFRVQAVAVAAAVAGFAVVLAITGARLADLTGNVFDQLTRADRGLYWAGVIVLAVAPAVLGAFWGAPLVARELEAGTHRLVWSQSVTRTRWLATKLGLTAAAAAAVVGVLTLAVGRWSAHLDGATSETHGSLPARLTPVAFGMRGVAPIGYVLFAVALGVAAGVLLRRSVPAMAATLVIFTFVQIAVPLWVRPHLVPPVTQVVAIGPDTLDGIGISGGPAAVVRLTVHTADRGDWVLTDETVDSAGRAVDSLPAWFVQCLPPPPTAPLPAERAGGPGEGAVAGCLSRLDAEGYRQRLVYQPADRFWPLQWAETGLFIGLAGLLGWFSFWWVRRRLA